MNSLLNPTRIQCDRFFKNVHTSSNTNYMGGTLKSTYWVGRNPSTSGLSPLLTRMNEEPPDIPMMMYSSPSMGSVHPQISLPDRLKTFIISIRATLATIYNGHVTIQRDKCVGSTFWPGYIRFDENYLYISLNTCLLVWIAHTKTHSNPQNWRIRTQKYGKAITSTSLG